MLNLNGSVAAPSPNEIQQKASGNLVVASLLKTTELELNRRGLLPTPDPDLFHPFWFLVETERNIFLWRRGLSLDSAEAFEFWVNVEQLVTKRLRQLDCPSENPFTNPLWELGLRDQAATRDEREYLLKFQDLMRAIEMHAAALSKVGEILSKDTEARKMVVLPEFQSLKRSTDL